MGLRDRKKEQTRVDIIRAAVDLFREKGYEATTVEDIVARANYSRSTFFRYFGSKEDVVFGDMPDRLLRILEDVRRSSGSEDLWKSSREALTQHAVEDTTFSPELAKECLALWFTEPALRRRYGEIILNSERVLAKFFAEGWGVDSDTCFECQVIAAAMIGVARAAVWAQLSGDCGLGELLDHGFDVLEKGFAEARPQAAWLGKTAPVKRRGRRTQSNPPTKATGRSAAL